jgi:membrane-bound metal-dependent hydrolase YbcI (DUF457 family)
MGSTHVVTVRIHPNPIFSMEFYCMKLIVASFISCFCHVYNDVLLIRQIWFLLVKMDQMGSTQVVTVRIHPNPIFSMEFYCMKLIVASFSSCFRTVDNNVLLTGQVLFHHVEMVLNGINSGRYRHDSPKLSL